MGYIESISKMVDMGQAAEKFAIDCIKPAMERVGLLDKEDDDYSMPKLRYFLEFYAKIHTTVKKSAFASVSTKTLVI